VLHNGAEIFILQDEGSIDRYLGVSITQLKNLSFSVMQPSLIDCVTAFLGMDNDCTNKHLTPDGKLFLKKIYWESLKNIVGSIVVP
jgi:hypothetical protein